MLTNRLLAIPFAFLMLGVVGGIEMTFKDMPGGGWLLLASVIGLVCLYFIGKMLEPGKIRSEAGRKEKFEADVRKELTNMQHAGYSFHVRGSGSAGLLWPIGLVVLGILFLHGAWPERNLVLIALGLAMLIAAVPAAWQSLLLFGQPTATFSRGGFATPIHGAIPWDAVHGIDVVELSYKFTQNILTLKVPRLPEYAPEFAFVTRALYHLLFWRRKNVVTVVLRNGSDDPEMVKRIVNALWHAATGRI